MYIEIFVMVVNILYPIFHIRRNFLLPLLTEIHVYLSRYQTTSFKLKTILIRKLHDRLNQNSSRNNNMMKNVIWKFGNAQYLKFKGMVVAFWNVETGLYRIRWWVPWFYPITIRFIVYIYWKQIMYIKVWLLTVYFTVITRISSFCLVLLYSNANLYTTSRSVDLYQQYARTLYVQRPPGKQNKCLIFIRWLGIKMIFVGHLKTIEPIL